MAKKKKNNTVWWVVGGLALTGAILGLRKEQITIGEMEDPNDQANSTRMALKLIADNYGRDRAAKAEQLIRKETRHFESRQWKQGNTAGMESFKSTFPFGWSSLRDFVEAKNIDPGLFTTYTMQENNTGKQKTFIRFPSAGIFVLFLDWFITNKRGGHYGKWYSLDLAAANTYQDNMAAIRPRIVESLG